MRSRTSTWFECKIRYEKTMEDGSQKKVTELYVVADRWYKTKLQFITIDDKTEKEKKSNVNYLVHGSTLPGAVKSIDEVMGGTMIDYVIASIAETQIMDVFEHNQMLKKPEVDDKPEYEQDGQKAEEALQ